MREVDPTWTDAVFVCTHERTPETGRASCGLERGSQLRDWLKSRMKAAGLKGVVLTAKSGCLGVCSPLGDGGTMSRTLLSLCALICVASLAEARPLTKREETYARCLSALLELSPRRADAPCR